MEEVEIPGEATLRERCRTRVGDSSGVVWLARVGTLSGEGVKCIVRGKTDSAFVVGV